MVLVSLLGQLICLIGIYILFLHYSSNSTAIQQYSIYLTIFAFMSFGLIFNNIRNVLIKLSIPTALLTSANSYLQAAAQTIQVCGPILSGFVLFFSDLSNGILACIICLVASIVLFTRIDFLNVATQRIREKFNLKNIVLEPLKKVIRDKTLRHFTILAMITNIAEGISGVMYIYFFKTVLLLNTAMIGMFFSVMGVGAITGGLMCPILRKRFEDLSVINIILLMLIVLYFLMGFTVNLGVIAIFLFFQGAGSMVIALYVWSIRQERVAIENMGRVVGITSAIFKLGMPISIVATGMFMSNHNIIYSFYICALVYAVGYIVNMQCLLNKSLFIKH